jgi:hypothetical protein
VDPAFSPEISESVFLAYRLTGDPRYRAYAWDIFSAIERHCRLPEGGYATILDVDRLPVSYLDKQETFFLVRPSLLPVSGFFTLFSLFNPALSDRRLF